MPETATTRLGLAKPEVGGSESVWGDRLNANADRLDGFLAAMDDLFVGCVFTTAAVFIPGNTLPIDGRAVSRTGYAKLFAKIGTTFGAGDGTTTFNIPDGRGRALVGADVLWGGASAGRLFGGVSGWSGGASVVTLTVNELPTHTHGATTVAAGSHAHAAATVAAGAHQHDVFVQEAGSHAHTATALSAGAHDHYLGRAVLAEGAAGAGGGTLPYGVVGGARTEAAGAHEHPVSVGTGGAHVHAALLSSAGAHTHAVTVAADGQHTHAVSVGAFGGNAPHTNVQPSVAFNAFIYCGIP